MKTAFLFPGQGMEEPAMGVRATEAAAGRALLDRASAATGVDLRRLLVEGGPGLGRTDVLQPLLAAVCLALLGALRAAGISPGMCAGHSVGELNAWAAAGGISDETAISLAVLRGRLMAREAARHPGGMLVLQSADPASTNAALLLGRRHGILEIAAENAPDQTVLAGDFPSLQAVVRAFPSRRLAVSGAWHGPSMAGAFDELRAAVIAAPRGPLACALVANRDGRLVADAEALPDLVAGQLVHPVRWADTLRTLEGLGATDYIAVGPGRVLRGLLRLNLGGRARVHLVSDLDDVPRVAAALKAA